MTGKVFGITGWKNSGKTTLTERLVAEFTRRGYRISTVKHAHHSFDIDKERLEMKGAGRLQGVPVAVTGREVFAGAAGAVRSEYTLRGRIDDAARKRFGIDAAPWITGPADVDLVMTYDSFTITVLLALEDLGFCPKGEGGAFVADGKLGPGGALPTNTNGGGLSYTHPGMYGMFLLVEATRQLRGEGGDRQVPGAEIAVAHGCGGVLSATSTIVLGSSR